MRRLGICACVLVFLAAGLTGDAEAALCPKCRDMMFTCDIGRCSDCGGDTASGAFRLCTACGDKLGLCQACRVPLKGELPADDKAKAAPPRPAAGPVEHKLPAGPEAAVIQYSTGAHILGRMMPSSGPDLVILADGTVLAHDPFGRPPMRDEVEVITLPPPGGAPPKADSPKPAAPAHVASVRGSIKPAELQDLLRFIIDENRFFEFNSRAAMDKYNASSAPRIADAASTTFEVTADGRTHKEWVYAVDCIDYGSAGVPELARMQAVYNRLLAIRKKIIAEAGKPAAGTR